jgi:hypothetical protein
MRRRAAFPGPIAQSGADLGLLGPGDSGGGTRGCPWPGPVGQQVSSAPGWASMALPGSAREVRGDDRVELGPQQPGIAADQLDPCLHGGVRLGNGGMWDRRRVRGTRGKGGRSWPLSFPGGVGEIRVGQALICLALLSVLAMAILRGLAFSAIGIRNVNTPAS